MFEIHITTKPIVQKQIENFIIFCKTINVKPIIIELEEGDIAQQPMISKVIKTDNPQILHQEIDHLKEQFNNYNYTISRVKIEVPLSHIFKGRQAFPNYGGQYFEWHGKLEFNTIEQLKEDVKGLDAHLSNNSLKGENNLRFLTVRTYATEVHFKDRVNNIKKQIEQKGYRFVKEEFEYCIYDSNKRIDKGWIDIPEITDSNYADLLACEGFLRRASQLKTPFILKGSLLTRQFIENRDFRNVNDIDFVYSKPLDSEEEAFNTFSDWVKQVTKIEIDDKITFSDFDLYDYWRGIDYAMHDDFPTASIEIENRIAGRFLDDLPLDVSWNLPIDEAPVSLLYQPLEGEPFEVPQVVPFCLQVSWKLHQSIVRPRAKDLLDIILLLQSNQPGEGEVEKIIHHFIKECNKDEIDPRRLAFYTSGQVSDFYLHNEEGKTSEYRNSYLVRSLDKFGFSVNPNNLEFGLLRNTFRLNTPYLSMYKLFLDFEAILRAYHFSTTLAKYF